MLEKSLELKLTQYMYFLFNDFIQGGKEYLMRAHFSLPSVEGEDSEGKPPIHVKFEIPYFTVSGIQVNSDSLFLKYLKKQ